MSQLFLHIFESLLWVITKNSENLFSERAVALEFNWRQYCSLLMVRYNSNTKHYLVEIADFCSSLYVHFLFRTATNTKGTDVSSSMLQKCLLTVLKFIPQRCPIVLPLYRKRLLGESIQCKWRLCSFNARESLFQLYPFNYIYKL